MASTCKTIVVNIQGFSNSPGVVYTVSIRPVGSQQTFGSNPALTKIATGPSVSFTGLSAELEYEVAIVKDCGLGQLSRAVWQNPIDPLCPSIISLAFNGTNTFTIELPSGTLNFEWRIDGRPWVPVASNNTATRTVTFANIAANPYYADGYGTDPDSLHVFEVRPVCSISSKGVPVKVIYCNVTGSVGNLELLENLCQDGFYAGQLFRLSITSQSTATQNLVYTPPGGPAVTVATWTRTNDFEQDIQIIAAKLNGFNIMRVISNVANNRVASVDFISHTPPEGIEPIGPIPCGVYASYYSIT